MNKLTCILYIGCAFFFCFNTFGQKGFLGPDRTICLECIELSAPPGKEDYQWSTGERTRSITYCGTTAGADTILGKYIDIAFDPRRTIEDTIIITTIASQIVYQNEIIQNDMTICKDSCITLKGQPDRDFYQWYGSVVLANTQNFMACLAQETTYHLLTTVENNETTECFVDSVTVAVEECSDSTTSISNESNLSYNFYPNPVEDILNISVSQLSGKLNIYNQLGAIVYSGSFTSNSSFNLAFLESGIYQVILVDSNAHTLHFKIYKQ